MNTALRISVTQGTGADSVEIHNQILWGATNYLVDVTPTDGNVRLNILRIYAPIYDDPYMSVVTFSAPTRSGLQYETRSELAQVCPTPTDPYRFGFNGQQKDNEYAGIGNSLEFKYRGFDPRIGRFRSVDPLVATYPWNSPYAFAENKPISGRDLKGLEYGGAIPFPVEPLIELPRFPIPQIAIPAPPAFPLPPAFPPVLQPLPNTGWLPNLPQPPSSLNMDWSDWEKVGDAIDMTDTKTWPQPPLPGNWQESDPEPGQKRWQQAKDLGHKRLKNENGDVVRPHLPDKQHPRWHWDFRLVATTTSRGKTLPLRGLRSHQGKFSERTFLLFPIS